MWRLSQGPVSLTFLTERDSESGAPRFRLRDIRVRDLAGNTIAKAPRAAVDVGGWALLSGRLEPVAFELIGPRITVRRQLDGTIQLGFGPTPEDAAPEAADGLGASDGKDHRSDMVLAEPKSGTADEN